jgi:hypothetical protein
VFARIGWLVAMEKSMLSLAMRTSLYNNGPVVLGVNSTSSSSSSSTSLNGTTPDAISLFSNSTADERKTPLLLADSPSSSSDDGEHEDEEATTSSGEVSPPYRKAVTEERTQPEYILGSLDDLYQDRCSRPPRRVGFSFVHIRRYAITIGDHPLTNMYPLTLDWCYADDNDDGGVDQQFKSPLTVDQQFKSPLTVDESERIKDDEGRPRQRHNPSAMPSCRGIKAPRLTVNQRIERLVEVTGMNSRELFALERQRQIRAQEESFGHHRRNPYPSRRPAANHR